jgi:hypothetical protein
MKITDMIKRLGGNRTAIAQQANTTVHSLNNAVSKGAEVEQLVDGRYISVNRFNIFYGDKAHLTNKGE